MLTVRMEGSAAQDVVVVVMSSHGCKGGRGGQSTGLSGWVLGDDEW